MPTTWVRFPTKTFVQILLAFDLVWTYWEIKGMSISYHVQMSSARKNTCPFVRDKWLFVQTSKTHISSYLVDKWKFEAFKLIGFEQVTVIADLTSRNVSLFLSLMSKYVVWNVKNPCSWNECWISVYLVIIIIIHLYIVINELQRDTKQYAYSINLSLDHTTTKLPGLYFSHILQTSLTLLHTHSHLTNTYPNVSHTSS